MLILVLYSDHIFERVTSSIKSGHVHNCGQIRSVFETLEQNLFSISIDFRRCLCPIGQRYYFDRLTSQWNGLAPSHRNIKSYLTKDMVAEYTVWYAWISIAILSSRQYEVIVSLWKVTMSHLLATAWFYFTYQYYLWSSLIELLKECKWK